MDRTFLEDTDMGAVAANLPMESVAPDPTGRVLLVDDDPAVLRAFARVLRNDGYEVTSVDSGEEALSRFETESFHAVVSDISMPGISGIEIIQRIKVMRSETPIVLITGMPTVETAIQAMDHGAMRYLLKPVDTDELRSVVAAAVRRSKTTELQHRADEAVKVARQEKEDADLRQRFTSALDKLFMVYQPIIRWSDRSISGYEALVRSSEKSIPHPGALFEAAERLDAMTDLGQAIREATPGPMMVAPERGRLFYNLHVRDLEDERLYDTSAPLAQMAHRVVLEITERAAIEDIKDAPGCVRRLREMGFRIAVDDLGAGYAGLNSFAELEPDVVKLDMTLVRNVHLSPTKQKVIRSITALCSDMELEVVAEGVENTEERDCLIELGCDLFQGYYFAKPAVPFIEPRF